MDVSGYLKKLSKAKFSETECPSCGSPVLTTNPSSFCHFCEMFIFEEGPRKSGGSARQTLLRANTAIRSGDWLSGIGALAPLENSTEPLILYGMGNIYKRFSDYTYGSVNYSLGGFMNSNADKRNDEFNRNKNNSMHLLSQSKEFLFRTIYLISNQMKSDDWLYLYAQFMAEMRLKRYAQAHVILGRINGQASSPISGYANMVYAVETRARNAESHLKPLLGNCELNAFYYASRYLINSNRFSEAKKVLLKITGMASMPMAQELLNKMNEIEEATKL